MSAQTSKECNLPFTIYQLPINCQFTFAKNLRTLIANSYILISNFESEANHGVR